jgi:hypothetical protein
MIFITRREFLKNTAAITAGSLYFTLPVTGKAAEFDKSRVVLIRDKNVLDNLNKIRKEVLSDMLNKALCLLFNTEKVEEAWKTIIQPQDVVGIKSNIWRFLPTPPELEQMLKEGVISAGVSEKNISIKDRGLLTDPVFMQSTALINVRPLRTHHWSGVGSLLKNYIMFVDKPWEYHNDSCADLGKLWKLPGVKDKTRLNILVMLSPLFHSIGPHHFNPEYTWKYNGLLLGTDPAAVDATGLRILQAKRKQYFGEEMPLNPPAKHIFLAETRHSLGNADPSKIDVIKSGWEEGRLI